MFASFPQDPDSEVDSTGQRRLHTSQVSANSASCIHSLCAEERIDNIVNGLQGFAPKNMADEMVIDGNEAGEQIYTAVDMEGEGDQNEVYIVSIGIQSL